MKKLIFILLVALLISEVSPLIREIKKFVKSLFYKPPPFCETLSEDLAGFCNMINGQTVYDEITQLVRNEEYTKAEDKCADIPYERDKCKIFVDKLNNYLNS